MALPRKIEGQFITFPRSNPVSSPKTSMMITRLEITDLEAGPLAGDSSICRYLPSEAKLTRSQAGVLLRVGKHELFYGYGRLDEVVNVPFEAGK